MPLYYKDVFNYDPDMPGNPANLDQADTVTDNDIPDVCILIWRITHPTEFESLVLKHGTEAQSEDGASTDEILKITCGKCKEVSVYATSEKWRVSGQQYGRNLTSGPIRKSDGSILCPEK